MNKLILCVCLFVVGCGSPVRRLRCISENQIEKNISYTVKNILQKAENAALVNDRYVMARFIASESEVNQIAKEIKKVDYRFKVVVKSEVEHTDLIVYW
jgi:hypothetical protein